MCKVEYTKHPAGWGGFASKALKVVIVTFCLGIFFFICSILLTAPGLVETSRVFGIAGSLFGLLGILMVLVCLPATCFLGIFLFIANIKEQASLKLNLVGLGVFLFIIIFFCVGFFFVAQMS